MKSQVLSKVLIVDDLADNLQALDALIRHEQRMIFHAASGEQALQLLLEHEFALAILDVQMPGMDGFELAELMRGTERTRHIPIVFTSAAGRELNYAFKGYETGAVDFLYKPLDSDAVRSKVNVFVALDQQRHEGRRQVAELEQSRKEQQQLVEELSATQAELQRSLRMRDDFMSLVAHELRTPLNTLFLESQMRMLQLQRGNLEALGPDRLPAMIARDQRQIQSMIRLIDDMLDVSRIRSGSLSIRPDRFRTGGAAQARGQRPVAAGDRLRHHAQAASARAGGRPLGRVPHRAGDHQPADQRAALRRRQAGRHRRRGRRAGSADRRDRLRHGHFARPTSSASSSRSSAAPAAAK